MTARHHPQLRLFRRGFSFAEVMFAVVILGIGFIMVAGIFPVALQQTQTSSQQAGAAAFAKNAASVMQQIASYNGGLYAPPTQFAAGGPTFVYPFDSLIEIPVSPPTPPPPAFYPHGSWYAVENELISSSDNRFAFIPLYSRALNSNFVQLYTIGVQVQNHTGYGSADLSPNPSAATYVPTAPNYSATLRPKLIQISSLASGSPSVITFTTGTPAAGSSMGGTFAYAPYASEAVDTGTYVILANDNINVGTPALPVYPGLFNGKIYRVGAHRPDLNTNAQYDHWELIPGGDVVPQLYNGISYGTTVNPIANADAWICGKGLTNPGNEYSNSSPINMYTGGGQDISLFTTYLSVK